jgi:hypothetical protein
VSQTKWFDGRMVQGAYRQWLVDEHPEALELVVIDIIARFTLGYRRRYAYLEETKFNLSHNKKYRQIKKAEELGLLEYRKTKGYTMYKLVLPEDIEENTQWRNGLKKESSLYEEQQENGW